MKDFIETISAILIMGLMFWIGIKIKTIWRNHSCLKNTNKSAGKEENAFLNVDAPKKEISFWRRNKVFFIAIIVVVFLVVGSIYYSRTQEREQNELACLQMVYYRGNSIYRIVGKEERNFKTQSEAMNYCLKVLY